MTRQRAGTLVAALGALVIVVGALGLVLEWGKSDATVRVSVTVPSGALTTSTLAPTAPAQESLAQFAAEFSQAIRNGDATYLPSSERRSGAPGRTAGRGAADSTIE